MEKRISMEFNTALLPLQEPAIKKLSPIKVGALYMEMGTGKTRTALALIARRFNAGKIDHVIWLCPCSVKPTIQTELSKHVAGDLSAFTVAGIESLSSSVRLNSKLLLLAQSKSCFIIIDESNLVKNHRAIRTQNIERIAGYCKYRLLLNGTPISKSEKDLYAQWHILDWRILGYQSFWSFAANHLEYDKHIPGKISRVLEVDYLVRKIAPYTYQVKKSECLDLPPKTYSTKYFDLARVQRLLYEDVKEEFLMAVDEMEPTTIYRLFTALQHVVSGNAVVSKVKEKMRAEPMSFGKEGNPRLNLFMDLVSRTDEKIIVWCKYTHEIQEVTEALKKEYGNDSVVQFYGEISKKARQESDRRFAQDPCARFSVGNKTCGGYGRNLQFCSYMIYYSNDWDWATRAQSEDRSHRIGQVNNLHIIDICARKTIDNRILNCLWRKEGLVDCFKSEIARLQNKDDLRRWLDAEDIHKQKCI